MIFDHFRVPREALLNRTGDVSESGVYVSPFKDKKKRLGELCNASCAINKYD